MISCLVISDTQHGVNIELLFFNHYNNMCIYIAVVNNKISYNMLYNNIMYTLGHNIIKGAYNLFISISAVLIKRTTNEKAEIDGRAYADCEVFSSHRLDVAFSQKTCITCP